MKTTKSEKLHQLNTVVITEPLPAVLLFANAAYLFTETPDNQESVLRKGAELFHTWRVSHLLLIDNLGGSKPGYPGAPPWQKRLRELNVPDNKVILIPFHEPVLHTLSEAFAMVQFAKERGWKKLIISFPSFHGTRCFLSAVTAIHHIYPELRVYCQVGITQPWNEPALHSQKAVHGLRKDLIVHELRRTMRYQRKSKFLRLITDGLMFLKAACLDGTLFAKLRKIKQYAKQGSPVPLVSTADALAYLEWRDSKPD